MFLVCTCPLHPDHGNKDICPSVHFPPPTWTKPAWSLPNNPDWEPEMCPLSGRSRERGDRCAALPHFIYDCISGENWSSFILGSGHTHL